MDSPLIRKANWVMVKAHEKQRRWQDVPFAVHPMRVADIVRMDDDREEAIAVALLHDVLEDTDFTLLEFPADVRLFCECLKEDMSVKDRKQRRFESLKRLNYVTSDIPTRVKIADRLDNLRDAALSNDNKGESKSDQGESSFDFYKESTEELLRLAAERGMDNEYGYNELWELFTSFWHDKHKCFQNQQDRFMVKATKGSAYRHMLYPGPGLGGQGASF